MFSLLFNHIKKRVDLTDDELKICSKFFFHKRIKKNQFFLQEGEICRNIAFVIKGCMRVYTIDNKGTEHIIQFAISDWWISDLHSYLTEKPATYNIDALQTSEVLLLSKPSREEMLITVPKMERFFRLLQESNYVATHKRITDSLSITAEERYLKFIRTYPAFLEIIPQKQIASYLGITPQSLSRIRKEISLQ
jgi:CRP-like cAMP-binding protein